MDAHQGTQDTTRTDRILNELRKTETTSRQTNKDLMKIKAKVGMVSLDIIRNDIDPNKIPDISKEYNKIAENISDIRTCGAGINNDIFKTIRELEKRGKRAEENTTIAISRDDTTTKPVQEKGIGYEKVEADSREEGGENVARLLVGRTGVVSADSGILVTCSTDSAILDTSSPTQQTDEDIDLHEPECKKQDSAVGMDI